MVIIADTAFTTTVTLSLSSRQAFNYNKISFMVRKLRVLYVKSKINGCIAPLQTRKYPPDESPVSSAYFTPHQIHYLHWGDNLRFLPFYALSNRHLRRADDSQTGRTTGPNAL